MLRIFHTADWHLGQTFHGFDRDYEHGQFLEWLLSTITERKPDVLLVAGDVFDSVNPPATAQRRFYSFLARAHAAAPALQIVLTAGNHDAAARLEAPAALLESLNITVVGTVVRNAAGEINFDKFLVPLKDSAGQVKAIALAVPFLRPSDVPEVPESSDFYLDGIREFYSRVLEKAQLLRERICPGAPLVALGHCHMQDAEESRDSERRIVIGGAEALRVDTFPAELVYVALGHLHRPQEIDGGRIRYCGSPIPLSFSEKDYSHRVLELSLDHTGLGSVTPLPVPKTTALMRLPSKAAAPMTEILKLIEEADFGTDLSPDAHPFLEVRVLDDGPDPTRRRRIEQALDGKPVRLASIRMEALPKTAAGNEGIIPSEPTVTDLNSLDPEEILTSAYRERYGADPDSSLLAALREILNSEAITEAAAE